MPRPLLAAVLIASLAACGAEGTDGSSPSQVAATAGETTAMSPPTPSPTQGQAEPALSTSEADESDCGADKLARWLNVEPTETVKAEIAATVGKRPIRYYTQGDPVTLDFSPSRLNVELGKDGRIKLFRCG